MEIKKNIVILGAGFGGLKCALGLAKKVPNQYQVILIDKNKYQNYHAMLYEIATANLDRLRRFDFEKLKETAAFPFKEIFTLRQAQGKIKFQQDTVQEIDLKNNLVILRPDKILPFEHLVFALGSETNYFNIPRASEKSFSLKNIQDAMNIRNALDEFFYTKKQKEKIQIVIAGGGFAGCELASELSYFVKKLSLIHNFPLERVTITIVEASKRILPGAREEILNLALERLKSLKIRLLLEQPIQEISEKEVITQKGEKIEFDQLIWTAGVQANSLLKMIGGLPLAKNSCLVVNSHLQIGSFQNIFGVGDNIYCFDPKTQKPVIATAQAALDQAKVVSKNILQSIQKKPLITYRPHQPFFVIPLGGKYALVDLKILILKSWPAWLFKHLVNLKYFLSILPIQKALTLWISGLTIFQKND